MTEEQDLPIYTPEEAMGWPEAGLALAIAAALAVIVLWLCVAVWPVLRAVIAPVFV